MLGMENRKRELSTGLHVRNRNRYILRIALPLDLENIKRFQRSALSQQGNDQTQRGDDQKPHKDIDEIAQNPSSPVDKAQDEDTHGDLDKACADDESHAFDKGPLDILGELLRCQRINMPAGAIRNLINIDHRYQEGQYLSR